MLSLFSVDKAEANQLSEKVNDASLLLCEYNQRLSSELDERKKVAFLLRSFINQLKAQLQDTEKHLLVSCECVPMDTLSVGIVATSFYVACLGDSEGNWKTNRYLHGLAGVICVCSLVVEPSERYLRLHRLAPDSLDAGR